MGNSDLASTLGFKHLRAGELTQALRAFKRQKTSSMLEESNRLVGLAVVLTAMGRADEAGPLLDQAVSADSSNATALHERGLWRARSGATDDALIDLRRAADVAPSGELLRDYGATLAVRRRFAEAIEVGLDALTYDDAPRAELFMNLATCYRNLGDLAEATRCLDAAGRVQPSLTRDERFCGMLQDARRRLFVQASTDNRVGDVLLDLLEAESEAELGQIVDEHPFVPTREVIAVLRRRSDEHPELAPVVEQRIEAVEAGWIVV